MNILAYSKNMIYTCIAINTLTHRMYKKKPLRADGKPSEIVSKIDSKPL
jgi:hypothetical protein